MNGEVWLIGDSFPHWQAVSGEMNVSCFYKVKRSFSSRTSSWYTWRTISSVVSAVCVLMGGVNGFVNGFQWALRCRPWNSVIAVSQLSTNVHSNMHGTCTAAFNVSVYDGKITPLSSPVLVRFSYEFAATFVCLSNLNGDDFSFPYPVKRAGRSVKSTSPYICIKTTLVSFNFNKVGISPRLCSQPGIKYFSLSPVPSSSHMYRHKLSNSRN